MKKSSRKYYVLLRISRAQFRDQYTLLSTAGVVQCFRQTLLTGLPSPEERGLLSRTAAGNQALQNDCTYWKNARNWKKHVKNIKLSVVLSNFLICPSLFWKPFNGNA